VLSTSVDAGLDKGEILFIQVSPLLLELPLKMLEENKMVNKKKKSRGRKDQREIMKF